jgi:hypothetical protein
MLIESTPLSGEQALIEARRGATRNLIAWSGCVTAIGTKWN